MSIFAAKQWKNLINCVQKGSYIYQAHSRMPFVRCLTSDVSERAILQTLPRGQVQLTLDSVAGLIPKFSAKDKVVVATV